MGDTFRFGYLYEIAGYPIYSGELILALGALLLAALVCMFRKTAAWTQIIMAVLLFMGVVICFVVVCGRAGTGTLGFLIPNIISIATLSTESYLILSVWSICGFLYFRNYLRRDHERRMGKSIVTWVVLLGLIVLSLLILLNIYSIMQEREKAIDVEKARAEETSRAKTSFLSNMSHEIRTPMNAIIGLQNIAVRDPNLTPRTKDQLEKIGSSAKHLLGLINDILDMTGIEEILLGKMILMAEDV